MQPTTRLHSQLIQLRVGLAATPQLSKILTPGRFRPQKITINRARGPLFDVEGVERNLSSLARSLLQKRSCRSHVLASYVGGCVWFGINGLTETAQETKAREVAQAREAATSARVAADQKAAKERKWISVKQT